MKELSLSANDTILTTLENLENILLDGGTNVTHFHPAGMGKG